MEGDQPKVLINSAGQPADAVGRRVHRKGRAAGRADRQASAGHQSEEHGLQHQALHGPPAQRGGPGREDGALRNHRRGGRDGEGQRARQGLHAGADLRVHPPGSEEDRRGLSRREGDRRGHHRAGVLQRRPAQGDQGRRRDRRAESPARAARADGGGPGVRAGQEEERKDLRLRPGRRHVRRVGASTSATASSKCSASTATRTSAATTSTKS